MRPIYGPTGVPADHFPKVRGHRFHNPDYAALAAVAARLDAQMAGSGELSRKGNTRALNGALNTSITSTQAAAAVCPPGDQIAALSATLATGAQTSLACAASGGGSTVSKALADDSVIIVCDSAGAVDTMELFCVNGAVAAAATSITFDSQTVRTSHAAGSLVFAVAARMFAALLFATPGDNALGSELAFTGYARQPIPWTAPTAADPPVASTSATMTFGPMSGADGTKTVGFISAMDCLSAGAADNQQGWWTLAATRVPNAGDSIQVSSGALTMQVFH